MVWYTTLQGGPCWEDGRTGKRRRYMFFNEADNLAFAELLRERFPDIRFYLSSVDLVGNGLETRLATEAELHALRPIESLVAPPGRDIEIVRCPPGWEPEWQVEEVPEGYTHVGVHDLSYIRYRLLNPLELVISYKPRIYREADGSVKTFAGGLWTNHHLQEDRELLRWAGQVWRLVEKLATNKHPLWGPHRRDQKDFYPKENLVTIVPWTGWNLIEERVAAGGPLFAGSGWMHELGQRPWPPPEGALEAEVLGAAASTEPET